MKKMREMGLIKNAGPCDTDYTDKSIQSLSDAKKKGRVLCSNLEECQKKGIFCTLNLGWRMAKFVMVDKKILGSSLESERQGFLQEHPEGKFWVKQDGKWSVIEGKVNVINDITNFIITVIDEDPSKFKPSKDKLFEKPLPEISMKNVQDNIIKDLTDMAKEFKKKE